MAKKHTLEELNNCSREELITIVLMMQGQLEALNENIEKLIEQVRLANSHRFGKHTETLGSIEGHFHFLMKLSFLVMNQSQNQLPKKFYLLNRVKRKKENVRLISKSFQKKSFHLMVFLKKNWILFMVRVTGAAYRMKPTRDFAMNQNHGLLKCILWRFMLVQMENTKMNLCVESAQRIFFATASLLHHCLPLFSM